MTGPGRSLCAGAFARRPRGRGAGYVAARVRRSLPLVREGDPTRTLIDATRPVHARTRVRLMARNVVVAIGLADASRCTGCSSSTVGARGSLRVTAAAERVVGDPRALRGGHRHRGPLPAADRVEDVLRAARPPTRTPPPNTHVCPVCLGLPGALPVINRRAVEHVIATGLAIEATIPERTQWERKNYFYPDLPKGYQISQYAIPLRRAGPAHGSRRRTARSRCRSRAPTSRRTRPSSSTATPRARAARTGRRLGRLQPVGRAADGDRHRARHPHGRAGAPLRRGAPAAAARDRRERRRHGARPDAGRGERLAPAARDRGVRDAGRGQEHELVPLGRAGDRATRSSARARPSTRASRSSMETRGWDDGAAGDVPDARPRRRPTTTATSRSRTCRRSTSSRRGSTGSGPRCRSCRRPGGRGTRRSGSPRYDAAVLVADPAMTARVRGDRRRPARTLPAKEVANFVTGAHARVAKARRPQRGGHRRRVDARRHRRAPRRRSSTAASRDRSAGSCSTATSPTARRPPTLLAGAGPGPISDDAALLGHVDAVIAANPQGRRRTTAAGKPVDRVLRRPGHEGDRRRRGRRPGDPARPRSGWTLVADDGDAEPRAARGRRRADRRRRASARATRTGATWRSRSRTRTSPATRRGAAARAPDRKTGASVAMDVLRRQAQIGARDRDRRGRARGRGFLVR